LLKSFPQRFEIHRFGAQEFAPNDSKKPKIVIFDAKYPTFSHTNNYHSLFTNFQLLKGDFRSVLPAIAKRHFSTKQLFLTFCGKKW
jgi:hypothetical protein